jgi:hypothetical protein
VAALDKTFVTQLIAATLDACFPGTTCVLAAELFWRVMRSAVEAIGSGATPQLAPNGRKVVRTSDLPAPDPKCACCFGGGVEG